MIGFGSYFAGRASQPATCCPKKKKLQALFGPIFPCPTFCSFSEIQNLTQAQTLQDNVIYAAPEKPSLEATLSPDMGPVKTMQ